MNNQDYLILSNQNSNMLAIFILLLISWVTLRLGGEKLNSIGLVPNRRRGFEFAVGFLPSIFIALIYYVIIIIALKAEVRVNDSYSIPEFLKSSWWTLRSVLYEELLFRGALLFLAMRYFGVLRGLFLSAVVFGIYHWFSYNVFGNIFRMIHTFLITGIGGFAFAFAFAKIKSLYLPIGLHFGWNLITINIFSQGPLGDQLLISSTDNTLGGWWSLVFFIYQIALLPLITILCIKILQKKQILMPQKFL